MDGTIIRSLMRSKLRMKILRHLFDIYPNTSYISEIARSLNSDPSNVSGSMVGLGERYSSNLSLLSLNLITEDKETFSYYGINPDKLGEIREIFLVSQSFKRNGKNMEVMIE